MKSTKLLAVCLTLIAPLSVFAQSAAWQFRWQKGQVLSYQVAHKTSVTEVTGGNKVESSSQLNLTKRWQVLDVDAKGVATLQLSLAALRHEQARPGGEVLLFDSANLEKSTPELKEQMAAYVGKALALVRVDGLGRVVEVLQGAANRYESEPPFVLVLPGQAVQEGQAWQRAYAVTLEPPLGTGEKYPAAQVYKWTTSKAGQATLTLTTQLKAQPENNADRAPLLQKQPDGQIVFDIEAGRLVSAQMSIDKTLENHAGEGSSYRFFSQYTEQLIAAP